MLEWIEKQHRLVGPIPTNQIRAELSKSKGKSVGNKTWQTWAQDFRNFFPEVKLNSANEWTNSDWVESSDGEPNSDADEELDQIFDEMFGESEAHSSASDEEVPYCAWDGSDDEKQPEMSE